ncbi:hypothetical protein QJ856_gp0105 [Tupanvirus deep ocean]|uniref:Uncharacterized protein n=2 Tax=Tupanvirus TaxID=2094720 RepID=A0AC62AA13_9VIRU|nr:hypothetical protein QJ856_gp0105 [Tupanvirus deep ocean]QKU34622.1 hypothetical protein [Tupanvirus deep ocean]
MTCNCQCKCNSSQNDHDPNKIKEYVVNYLKNTLILNINSVEILNEYFDPLGLNLKGWTSELAKKTDEYTEVFEKLYEKYKDQFITKLEPERELALKIIIDGTSYHIKQKFVNNFDETNMFFN